MPKKKQTRLGVVTKTKVEKVLEANEEVDTSGEPKVVGKEDEDKTLKAGKEADIAEEPKPDELTANQRKNIERELRRYIAVAGGYIDNLPADRKKRCSALLKKIGRESDDLKRDYSLIGERE